MVIFQLLSDKLNVASYLQEEPSFNPSEGMSWSGLFAGDNGMVGDCGGEKYSGGGGLFGGESTSKHEGLFCKGTSSGGGGLFGSEYTSKHGGLFCKGMYSGGGGLSGGRKFSVSSGSFDCFQV